MYIVELLACMLALIIGLVMIFAQARLFSIDDTLKRIHQELVASRERVPGQEVPESLQTEVPASLARLAEKKKTSDGWVLVFIATGALVLALAVAFIR